MASTTTGAKRKGNFKLDTDDMERRLVEFRVSLDREKRRCQAAKMTDKFEKLLTDKLNEIGSQLVAAAGGVGGGGSGPDQGGQENGGGVRWSQIDQESVGQLNNLLTLIITQSGRVDQLDSVHDILRQNLLKTRLKRVRTAAELPPGQAQPLEPLCGFCGSFSKDSEFLRPQAASCNTCLERNRQAEVPIESDLVPSQLDDFRQSFSQYVPNSGTSQRQRQQDTPPASTPTTPEVGEQVGAGLSYTPNSDGGGGGGGGDGGSDGGDSGYAPQQSTPPAANPVAPRVTGSEQAAAGMSYTPNFRSGGHNHAHQQVTPPASNPTTPEVGEQATVISYTPNLAGGGAGGSGGPAHAHQKERQFMVVQRPTVSNKQPAPPQPQQQPQQTQQQRQHQLVDNINPNASSSSSRFVMPSDESSTDSETHSVRDILDSLAQGPSKYFQQRQLSSTPKDKKRDEKKMVEEIDYEGPSRLVIDEQCHGLDLSYGSKSIKKGPRSKTRPKRPNSQQQRP